MHTEILSRMSLFEGCDPEALYQLLREAPNSLRTYKEGEFIARQGDVCRSLFILIKGHVRTQMENAEGKQLTIDWIKAPDILAPAFIYASENRFPVNVEATELCEVLVMDRTRFEEFMHAQPAVMRNFIATISDRSLFLSRKLNEFALQSLTPAELPENARRHPQPAGSSLYFRSGTSVTGPCLVRTDCRRKSHHVRQTGDSSFCRLTFI